MNEMISNKKISLILIIIVSMLLFLTSHLLYAFSRGIELVWLIGMAIMLSVLIDMSLLAAFSLLFIALIIILKS